MNRFFSFLLCVSVTVISTSFKAQAPNGINYQAVIRNNTGTLMANTPTAIRVSIRQTTATGTIVYSERQNVTTDQFGLVNFVIGNGILLSGNFTNIPWGNGPFFLDLGVAFSGLPAPITYMPYGTQQMMSVPYALYAKSSGNLVNQWSYGAGVPLSAAGNIGDYYLDTATGNVYTKTNGTTWVLISNITGPQGAVGAVGPQGPAGVAGPQGIQGATGATGAIGPQGPIGLTGTTGATGATGPQGPIGLTGATGLQGPAGAAGTIGPQGPIGLTGPQGIQGATGPAGANGTNGTAVLNGITNPVGGTGVNGDFYINTATNELFGPKVNGTWPAGVSLVGPQGATGAIGPQGPAGLTGLTGPQGPIGLTGPQGPQGPIGLTGPIGATGLTGPQGAAGVVGPQGPIGLTGPQGIQGATGPAGANGTNGTAVLNGNTNPVAGTGVNGDFYINTVTNELFGPKANGAWPAGVSLVGPPGAQGIQGIAGPTGATGLQGPAGAQGPIGLTGPQGPQGIQGIQGPTGATGATGPQGPAGQSGNSLSNGLQQINHSLQNFLGPPSNNIGNENNYLPMDFKIDLSGNLVLFGGGTGSVIFDSIVHSNLAAMTCLLTKLDSLGGVIWSIVTPVSGINHGAYGPHHLMDVDQQNNIYVSNAGILYKYSPTGVILWQLAIDGNRTFAIGVDYQNNILAFCGNTSGSTSGKVKKISPQGSLLWTYNVALNDAQYNSGCDLELDGSGNIYYSFNRGGTAGHEVHKLSSNGNLLWTATTASCNNTTVTCPNPGSLFLSHIGNGVLTVLGGWANPNIAGVSNGIIKLNDGTGAVVAGGFDFNNNNQVSILSRPVVKGGATYSIHRLSSNISNANFLIKYNGSNGNSLRLTLPGSIMDKSLIDFSNSGSSYIIYNRPSNNLMQLSDDLSNIVPVSISGNTGLSIIKFNP